MSYRTMGISVVVVLAVIAASAQTKTAMTGKCSKPQTQQSVPAGDQEGHVFMVAQGTCSITGSVNGAVAKQGNYSEEVEATPTTMKNRGVYVVTFDSGDKVYYQYEGSATMKDGAYQAGTNKYQIAGGTGKLQGVNGSGSCKLTGAGDGGLQYTCTGMYHMGPPTGNNSRGKGRTTPVRQ
jgi:hypothetical protein